MEKQTRRNLVHLQSFAHSSQCDLNSAMESPGKKTGMLANSAYTTTVPRKPHIVSQSEREAEKGGYSCRANIMDPGEICNIDDGQTNLNFGIEAALAGFCNSSLNSIG